MDKLWMFLLGFFVGLWIGSKGFRDRTISAAKEMLRKKKPTETK